jgi:hypothetical protein
MKRKRRETDGAEEEKEKRNEGCKRRISTCVYHCVIPRGSTDEITSRGKYGLNSHMERDAWKAKDSQN